MISAVVLTKNEQRNIKDCLKSLQWCVEIIVIDDYSEDNTREIAKTLGAKVFLHHLNNNFAQQRNFALRQAQGEWVLFIDADERVSAALAAEIYNLQFTIYNGFYLKRRDFFGGKWLKHGETANVKLLRLGRNGAGRWQRQVHETWEIKGKLGELKNPILHYPHPTISEFLETINYFSTLHADVLFSEGVKTNLFQISVYPVGKFLKNWIYRRGFLDGAPGLIVALMMSFHSFLARAKLYIRWKN
jgi:glycosyltransferase involved in cell wall biosynthesis